MTPSELKYHVEQAETEKYYFTRDAMRFFGDTMANYGCRSAVVVDREGNKKTVWELWRKRAVKHGNKSSAYFDKVTFERVFGEVV